MLVSKSEVLNYIPQRPPMVMVDSLLENDDEKTISQYEILEDNIFCENGSFSEAGLIENMAQTAALQNGFQTMQNNDQVRVGFIGAVKKLKIYHLPEVNSTIETTVYSMHNFGNVSIVKAEVRNNSLLIAESELSIFTQE